MIDSDSSSSSCTSGNEDSQSQSQHEAKLQIEIMQRDKNKIPQDVYGLIHNISPSNITGSSGISFDGIRSISTDQNANYSFNQNNDGHTSTSSNLQMPISASTSNAQIPEYPKQDNPQVNPTRLTDSNDRDTITKSPGQHNSPSRITKHDGHRKGPRCKKPKMKYCKHNISGGRRNFLNNIFIISNCCDKCKVMLNSNLCHHSHTDMNTNNDVLQSRKSNENPSHNSHSTESVENYPNQIPDETYYNSSDQSDNQPSFNPSDRQSTGISTDAGLVSHQLPNAMLTSNRTTSKDECNRNLLPQNSPDPLLGCMFQSNEFVSEDRNRYLHSGNHIFVNITLRNYQLFMFISSSTHESIFSSIFICSNTARVR